ncbi:MAG: ComF family protein [Planctomycetota bacterium]|nr:ComF family protein [Planctomycetota bacterium]
MPAWTFLIDALAEVGDAVFPRRCFVCGAGAAEATRTLACRAHALPSAPSGPRCGVCAAALPEMLPDGYRCARCRRAGPGVRRVVALADYRRQPAVRDWILALKHGGRRDLGLPLGRALARRLLASDPAVPGEDPAAPGGDAPEEGVVVPVPLHPLRRMERGYDQALLLARGVAAELGCACVRALRRRRLTPPQGAPGASSRSANVRGAFAAVRAARRLAGRHVWLVDDVVTSGATVAECARELRRAGARTVSALCVARAG